ncbi:MAG TPA: alpha-E domain-containing protein [Terriglobales bacterium]|nr:alpha-E domain-containing protein [Terriglobales bacterium]
MLSRVAESLYWMSRYLERAEHTARLVDVDVQLRLDQSPESGTERWLRLFEALQIPQSLAVTFDAPSLTHAVTFDRSNQSSIVCCVAAARENLRHVREQCSSEMWEQLNRLYLQMRSSLPAGNSAAHSHLFFRSVLEGAHLFQGITDSTMSQGEGWQYIQLGRYVERVDDLAALIGAHFNRLAQPPDQAVESAEYLEWVGLLKSCAAFEAYCKAYSAELRPLRVAEFLLLDPEFPHSLRFAVEMVHTALRAIAALTGRKAELPVRLTGRLRALLNFTPIEEIMSEGASAYLENVRHQCAQAHAAIQQIYFDYAIEPAMVS